MLLCWLQLDTCSSLWQSEYWGMCLGALHDPTTCTRLFKDSRFRKICRDFQSFGCRCPRKRSKSSLDILRRNSRIQVDVNTRSKPLNWSVQTSHLLQPVLSSWNPRECPAEDVMTYARMNPCPKNSTVLRRLGDLVNENKQIILGEKGEEERRKNRCLLTFNEVSPLL